ncbi:MAG: hypothetical protein CMJ31_09605 [Phycisphaerae bacterium]|nr:hypothetical protein [Phycisphaerae bacterium]
MPLNADMFLTFDDVAAHCIGTLMTEGCDVQSPDLGIYAYVGLAIMAVFGQPVGADTISSHIAVITSEAAATDAWLLSQRCAYTADVIRLFRDNGHLDAEEAAALVGSLSDHQM